jgi:selenium-binding protein 1
MPKKEDVMSVFRITASLVRHTARPVALAALCGLLALTGSARADETCNSPYITNLIKGQEDFAYVWTLGVPGLGDGADKLVTIDVNPASPKYGKVVHTVTVGGRGEPHHMGLSDDRRYLWAGNLDDSKIFVFDIATDPGRPRLAKTIADLPEQTGLVGPHTFYALPGRILVGNLSNTKDHGGMTGLALYNNRGDLIRTYPMPTDGGGYGYDIAINPQKNALLTSSFTGWNNYMRNLGELIGDGEAMKHFGNTVVLWDLKAMTPRKVFSVPGAPLEMRWSLNQGDNWAVVTTALTSKIWLIKQDAAGEWQARDVAVIGDPSKIPLPVDISITADGNGLWVNTFMDGKTRYFDLSDPEHPQQTYEKVTGKQVNMISQSWDGKRVYITSSLLANWDKTGDNDEQFLRGFSWNGSELTQTFEVDFYKEKLGRAHHIKLGSKALKTAYTDEPEHVASRAH